MKFFEREDISGQESFPIEKTYGDVDAPPRAAAFEATIRTESRLAQGWIFNRIELNRSTSQLYPSILTLYFRRPEPWSRWARRKWNSLVSKALVSTGIVLILLGSGCVDLGQEWPKIHIVKYKVHCSSYGAWAGITWETSTGTRTDNTKNGEWSQAVTVTYPFYANVTAQLSGRGIDGYGKVTTEVWADNMPVATDSSNGPYAIASTRGWISNQSQEK